MLSSNSKRTRWAKRLPRAFGKAGTEYKAEHAAAIERQAPKLTRALKRARREWESEFWNASGLQASKAASDGSDSAGQRDPQIALTPDEIAQIRQAISQLSAVPFTQALYNDLEVLVETGFANAKQLLHIKRDLEDVKPSIAMDALRKHVEDFTFMVNTREQDYLNQLLDHGLAEGWTPGKLSSEIRGAFADGYHVMAPDENGQIVLTRTIPTDSWSEMVARTELNRAQTMGAMALYHAAQIQKVMWVTTGGENVCESICAPRDGQVYPINDAPEMPGHPRCNCGYMAADEDVAYDEAA